jgi:hypothetical protein
MKGAPDLRYGVRIVGRYGHDHAHQQGGENC